MDDFRSARLRRGDKELTFNIEDMVVRIHSVAASTMLVETPMFEFYGCVYICYSTFRVICARARESKRICGEFIELGCIFVLIWWPFSMSETPNDLYKAKAIG